MYVLRDVQELSARAQQVIDEGLSVGQQQIKRSIKAFYTDGYYQRMREALLFRVDSK